MLENFTPNPQRRARAARTTSRPANPDRIPRSPRRPIGMRGVLTRIWAAAVPCGNRAGVRPAWRQPLGVSEFFTSSNNSARPPAIPFDQPGGAGGAGQPSAAALAAVPQPAGTNKFGGIPTFFHFLRGAPTGAPPLGQRTIHRWHHCRGSGLPLQSRSQKILHCRSCRPADREFLDNKLLIYFIYY